MAIVGLGVVGAHLNGFLFGGGGGGGRRGGHLSVISAGLSTTWPSAAGQIAAIDWS